MAQKQLPALIICDIMMPELDGYGVLYLLAKQPDTAVIPFIFLTAKTERIDMRKGMEMGADDYITKPFSPREMLARIKAVLRRRSPEAADDMVEIGGLHLDSAAHRVTADGNEVVLGPTEFRLLHFLMTHAERVYSRSQLLDQVWGDHVFVEDRTVDVHIRRLRKALETVSKDGLVQTVRGSGYRLSAVLTASMG